MDRRSFEEMLSVIPADSTSVTYVDIAAIRANPLLGDALDDLGIWALLSPVAAPLREQADAMALAVASGAVLGAVRWSLDIEDFLNAVKAPESETRSQGHGAFEMFTVDVKLPFLTLPLTMSLIDAKTAVFALALSPGRSSADLVEAVLDTAEAPGAGFLSDPEVSRLVPGLPPGSAMIVSRDCRLIGRYEGCVGLAVSARVEGEEGTVDWILDFSSPDAGRSALVDIARDLAARSKGAARVEELAGGSRVRASATVGISEAFSLALGGVTRPALRGVG